MIHYGLSPYTGHYAAFVNQSISEQEQQWVYTDDNFVKVISEKELLELVLLLKNYNNGVLYILFYYKDDGQNQCVHSCNNASAVHYWQKIKKATQSRKEPVDPKKLKTEIYRHLEKNQAVLDTFTDTQFVVNWDCKSNLSSTLTYNDVFRALSLFSSTGYYINEKVKIEKIKNGYTGEVVRVVAFSALEDSTEDTPQGKGLKLDLNCPPGLEADVDPEPTYIVEWEKNVGLQKYWPLLDHKIEDNDAYMDVEDSKELHDINHFGIQQLCRNYEESSEQITLKKIWKMKNILLMIVSNSMINLFAILAHQH